jgi:hypothetical protein
VIQKAGYPLPEEFRETDSATQLAARVGDTTREEEALVEYLMFLRSHRQVGDR